MLFAKKLIEREEFLEAVGNERELIDTLLDLYDEQTRDCLKNMRLAYERNDASLFERAAHDLKNVGRNIASKRLIEHAQDLEEMAARGELEGAVRNVRRTEKLLRTAGNELAAIRKSL